MNEQNQNERLGDAGSGSAPRLETGTPSSQSPLPSPATAPTYSSAYPLEPAKQTNLWAVVSLVSSILSWCGLFGIGGIVGIIAGVVARNEIAASRGAQTGEGLALTGIILGALNVFGACIVALCVLTALVPLAFLPFAGW